jgi:hypothetical protein
MRFQLGGVCHIPNGDGVQYTGSTPTADKAATKSGAVKLKKKRSPHHGNLLKKAIKAAPHRTKR